MAFSKVKVGGLADDSVTAANIDDDGTGYTVGNLTNSGTLQQTGQVTLGTGSGSGGNWTLPTSRGTNDKYVLQINGTTGAADWAESLTAPEISGHNFDVSGSTDDGGINKYEEPYEYTGTTNATTTISALSSTTGLLAGQYISGAGIPADTTIVSVNTGASTMVISNAVTVAGTQTGVALKIQKTPGEKNGGKVTLTGTNFGGTIGEITVSITDSGGGVIANASYLSGLSSGTTITAEWTGTEGDYATKLKPGHGNYIGDSGLIYFKMSKSGLSSNVHNTNTSLTSDPAVTTLSTSSQTGGDRSATPSATSLGTYGFGRVAGGGQDTNTKLLLNFDRGGGTDFEDSSNIGGDGHKITVTNNAIIKATPFGDGRSAMYFDGSDDDLSIPLSSDFVLGANSCVEGWFLRHSGTANEMLISYGGASDGDTDGWCIRYDGDGTILVILRASSTNYVLDSDPTTYPNNTWNHVAWTRDGTTARLFINGKLIASNTASGHLATTPTLSSYALHIGQGHDNNRHLSGYVDEVRIVNGSAVYTSDFTVPTSRLTAITNTKLLIHSNVEDDASDNQIPITPVGASQTTTNARSAWGGSHWEFPANGEAMKVPKGAWFNHSSQDMCIEFWVRDKGSVPFAQNDRFFTFYKDGNNFFEIYWEATNDIRIGQKVSGTWGATWIFDPNNDDYNNSNGSWSHIAFTKEASGNSWNLYTDGVLATRSGSAPTQAQDVSDYNLYLFFGPANNAGNANVYMEDFRVTVGNKIYSGTDTSSANFALPTGPLTKTWSANPFGGSNTAANTDSSKVKVLLRGDGAKFTDSATSGTTHTITPTGVYHSQAHRGITPALAWPASGKKFGSSGVYFDGNQDNLTATLVPAIDGNQFTIDFWAYTFDHNLSSGGFIFDNRNSSNRNGFGVNVQATGRLQVQAMDGSGQVFLYTTPDTSAGKVAIHGWSHVAIERDGSGNFSIYINGIRHIAATSNSTVFGNQSSKIGAIFDNSAAYSFKGYIDGWRYSNTARYATSDFSSSLPTRAYGTYGKETPDAGTITLTATGEGDFTWSELTQGTALPGTLAVGSTVHSGSGNSRTHTATITGTLPVNTSTTYVNGVKGDTATQGILLKVQHDTDATKAVTLNGTTGMGITQKSTEKPILFNARRYEGNTTGLRKIAELGFQPDLVWIKDRDGTNSHTLANSVSGSGYSLYANTSAQQDTTTNGITGFLNGGFQLGKAGTGNSNVGNNVNGDTLGLIAWCFKAGEGLTTTPTFSNISSVTQSASSTSGFSITKYTGNSSGDGQFTHGLGGIPELIIGRVTDAGCGWFVWHKGLADSGNPFSGTSHTPDNDEHIRLDEAYQRGQFTGSAVTGTPLKTITDTVINLDSTQSTLGSITTPLNKNGAAHILYAWRSIPGVSAIGSHTGQITSVSGTTVGANGYCGFKPRFVMIKCTTDGHSWQIYDAFRDEDDSAQRYLKANSSDSEISNTDREVHFTSNGFTTDTYVSIGGSGESFISIAFA